jgi:type VI secretion system secreted protein VgrG
MPTARLPQVSYELRCSDGPATEGWRVHRFRMREGVSEPYQLLVDVVTAELEVEFEDFLGADVELAIVRGEAEPQIVHGIVVGIDWLGIADGRLQLRLDIRPAFALLAQRVDTRIWQDQSVLEIVDAVLAALGDYGRSHDKGEVGRGTTKREYCVQYRESDLDFVHRLLEEEGISYVFVQDGEKEVLTLIDEVAQSTPAANVDGSAIFPVIAGNPEQAELESIQALEWRRRLTSTGVLQRDFDWMAPLELLSATAGEADARGRERRVYSHGQRRWITDDLAKRAGDRRAGQNLPGTRGLGRGNATGFRAGLRIQLEGHELGQVGEELLLVRVEHEGHDPSALASGREAEGGYRNSFECMPVAAELRPPIITPKPRVHGPQTAIVCGAKGEEIEVDEHGRVRVQFHFQEQPKYDSTSSCWVRVAHNWAGAGWGFQFIPRIGMEVVVEFLEGNPDRPLVTGCVYNGVNPPPYALPDDKTQSGIKTNSSPGGGGSNELRFEDAAGSEEIYLHGQKDWTIAIENDKAQTIGHDESLEVANDRSAKVGHDESLEVGHDRTQKVGHDEKVGIGNDLTLNVGHDQVVTIGHDHSVTIAHDSTTAIANDARESVGANKRIAVGAAMQLSVAAAFNESVGGARAEEVGGAKAVVVGADHGEQAGGSRSIAADKDIVIAAKAAGTFRADAALGIMTADKLSMTAEQDLMIASKTAAMVEGTDKLTLKCGKAQIVLESSGDVTITGAKITIKGTSDVKIKGAKIDNN